MLVDHAFPVNMISAYTTNVKRRLENRKIRPKDHVPVDSNGLVNIVVVESILELSLFKDNLVRPSKELKQALVFFQSLESFSRRVCDLYLVDINAEIWWFRK